MAGSGKILTITYGTFTCMLEGFDDPLKTMTSIFDYLRYLDAIGHGVASDAVDRDILIGIAAGGTALQVYADDHAGGIRLRPVPPHAASTVPTPYTAPADPVTPNPVHQQDEMSRIFAETDMQFKTVASSRHRNAIQHARAALAASRADAPGVLSAEPLSAPLRLGPDLGPDQRIESYPTPPDRPDPSRGGEPRRGRADRT